MRIKYFACLSALLILALPTLVRGYAFITNNGTNVTWPAGTITMKIMADNATVLSDGTTRAGSIQAAMQAWSAVLGTVQFSSQIQAAGSGTDGNYVNEVFFSNTAYGKAWDSSTLAVTTIWINTNNSQRLEGDIILNTNFTWDSYRGSLRIPEDLRRIVLHELGHVLGLDHPDLATPAQYVTAVMNSSESDIDSLQADDIAGAQALYGAPNVAPSFNSQPSAQTIYAGQSVSFSVAASGSPSPSYRWQRLPAGSGTWANLSDNATFSGTGTSTLNIVAASTAMNGDQFRCVASNSVGSTASQAATLVVNNSFGVITAAAGFSHSLFVRVDGSLWGMGYNLNGELGDGTDVSRGDPVQISTQVVAVAAGYDHSLFLKSDGSLWATGYNRDGQLGDGTTTDRNSPAQVATSVVAIAAGRAHSLFLKRDGSLWGMGNNSYGQLGDGTTTSRTTPVQIDRGVVSFAAGENYSLYAKSDGSLWAMGANWNGSLGYTGGGAYDYYFVSPVKIGTGVVSESAEYEHSLFIKSDGTLWAMGYNNDGQLGDGTFNNAMSPEKIASGTTSTAAGALFSLFLKSDGTLWGMGYNTDGQLGSNLASVFSSPVHIADGVRAAVAGASHALYMKSDGTLWGLGRNLNGQLGSTIGDRGPGEIAFGQLASPVTPTGIAVGRDVASAGMILSWNPTIAATGYEVWRNTSNNPNTAVRIASNMPISLFYDRSPLPGINYYWVKAVNPAGPSSFSAGFSVTTPAIADFDHDGQTDIVWENTVSGQRYIWLMNGTSYTAGADLGTLPPEWRVAGTGDFNADGQTDILWENTVTGDRGIWLMNGWTVIGWSDLGIMPPEWHIAGTGDFNADGQTDILWENTTTGQRYMWLMNGTNFAAGADLGTLPPEWRIAGTGDFNGDGQTDILWENTVTGDRGIWLMNGSAVIGWSDLGIVPTDWRIARTGDFNGDGQPDIVWENKVTGERGMWLMNGVTVIGWAELTTLSLDWRIAP